MSPALLGVVAVTAAGLGSFATGEVSADDVIPTSQGFQAVKTPAPSDDREVAGAPVDVSRSYDRPPVQRETAALIKQRAAALAENNRTIAAKAAVLQEQKERRVKQAKERRVKRAEARQVRLEQKRRNAWVLPVAGYTLTARFGQGGSLWSSGAHTGLDFAGPSGTKIVAIAAGTVKSTGFSGAYGNRTVIGLADGTEIWYCHQSRIVVNVGDKVSPGQVTGYTGATGNVTGPHLHVEVRPAGATPVNPEPVMRAHGITP